MRALLTGATGYIGHQLAIKLADLDHKVHVLVRDVNSSSLPVHRNIIPFKGNICDLRSIQQAIEGCTYVFHMAAYTNMRCNKIERFYKTNVIGTRNILEVSFQAGVKKVIYTSTLAVFGPALPNVPITEDQPRLTSLDNDYELTKTMSEEEVFKYVNKGLHCTILNISRVYGPGLNTFSNGLSTLISKFTNDKLLIVPDKLDVEANYVFIDDVVKAELLAMKYGQSGENYIIGGENVDYNGLFGLIKTLTKSQISIVKLNYQFIKGVFAFLSGLYRLIRRDPPVTPKILDSLFTNRSASVNKAMKSLNYTITPLEIGLTKTINNLS